MSRAASALLAVPVVLLACGDRGRHPTTPPPSHDAADAGPADVDAGPVGPFPTAAAPPRIAPHLANIAGVAIDRTGVAAASLDVAGSVRLWRDLDGTAPPVAVPLRGARALEVAVDADGFTVGVIDGSAAAHLFHFDRAGGLLGVDDIPAVPQALGLVAAPDGAWLVARADQSIALTDAHGVIVDEVSRDGTRIEALRPAGARDAMAIISRQGDAAREFAAVGVSARDGHLTWQREQPLAIAPLAPVELAVAADGKRLAYFASPEAVKAAKAAQAAKPAQASGPRPAGGMSMAPMREQVADEAPAQLNVSRPAQAVVIDLATGADVTPTALAAQQVTGPQRLGFLGADAIAVFSQGSGDWVAGLAPDADLVASPGLRNSPPAVAGDRVIAGNGPSLAVTSTAGATRFLGYQLATADTGALAPDGATAAWATGSGQLVIAPTTGGEPRVVALVDPATTIDFVDAHTLVVATSRGGLMLIDAVRGDVLETTTTLAPPRGVVVAASGRWIAGVRDAGGMWVVPVDLATRPRFGAAHVLADGSFAGWFQDAADPAAVALITVDGSAVARSYTGAQLATGVPVNKLGTVAHQDLRTGPMLIDGAGHPYEFDGRDLIRYEGLAKLAPRAVLRTDNLHLIAAVPGAELTLAGDASGMVRAVAKDGTLVWSTSLGQPLSRLAVSADGRRAVLVAATGTKIVDVSTGDALTTACGWQYGAWPTPPPLVNVGAPSICE